MDGAFPPQRSAIPKVMGILMIIFASLGLLGTLRELVGSRIPAEALDLLPELKTWRSIELVIGLIGLGVGVLHLAAGVRAVSYKANAPRLAVIYSATSMLTTLVSSTLIYIYLRPLLGSLVGNDVASIAGPMMIVTSLVQLTWPVLVMILMTRPAAQEACVDGAHTVRLAPGWSRR